MGRRPRGRRRTAAPERPAGRLSRSTCGVDHVIGRWKSQGFDVGLQLLTYSRRSELHGLRHLEDVCGEWVRLVIKHGRAMVHTRSDEGYLARLRAGARHITVQVEAVEGPIAETAAELGIPAPGEEGLFLWNVLSTLARSSISSTPSA